ncbi:MAG TPA: four helix bundle protein [Draconibacterium sp.]|nr:four helix bundle protein [Draconibacterium sp.]
MAKYKIYDLEDRLIDFTIKCSEIVEELPSSKLANHIGGQLIRASSSPALNYGEAQSAESPNDFIHKLKVILKELRESRVCLKIILRKPLLPESRAQSALDECNELIAIFLKSIDTAKKNRNKK